MAGLVNSTVTRLACLGRWTNTMVNSDGKESGEREKPKRGLLECGAWLEGYTSRYPLLFASLHCKEEEPKDS